MSINERQSLSKLTVVGATAEPICQPPGPILTQWNQSQKLKSWRWSSWNSRLMYFDIWTFSMSSISNWGGGEKKEKRVGRFQAFTTQHTCPHLFTPGQKQISFETLCVVWNTRLQTTVSCLEWQMLDKVQKSNNPKYLTVLQFQNHNKILNIKCTDDQQENSDMRTDQSTCLLYL